jgi:hypothetical protein
LKVINAVLAGLVPALHAERRGDICEISLHSIKVLVVRAEGLSSKPPVTRDRTMPQLRNDE